MGVGIQFYKLPVDENINRKHSISSHYVDVCDLDTDEAHSSQSVHVLKRVNKGDVVLQSLKELAGNRQVSAKLPATSFADVWTVRR